MKEKKRNYQIMSGELAEIIEWFESDKVNLDEAVSRYEQALKLISEIEVYLKSAENKIKKISTKFE
ncbi:exodeoxyribonuclease VII small subunit [Candidatus Saccharibacteria bacterium]|nr:exodeoxyribonuclease VII small subunit [Candidatus Saccharibacteria bacterium]